MEVDRIAELLRQRPQLASVWTNAPRRIGASASFATPIGYQTNTLVYSAGGYRFLDFIRIGVPMNIIIGVVTVFVISLIWPLGG